MNVPSTVKAGTTFTSTWTSPSKSISGDWVGLFVKGGYTAYWSSSVTGGLSTGTLNAKMPNSPGTVYNFGYVRNGYIIGYSTVITCTSSSAEVAAGILASRDSITAADTPLPTLKDSPPPTLKEDA